MRRDVTRLAGGLLASTAKCVAMAGDKTGILDLDRMIGRASKPRGAAIVIAGVTTSITIIAGLLMTVLDHDGFPTIGSGLWWAVQTVTTVGYGDHVPTTAVGQLVAAAVMLLGIGFVTVITASITSVFVAQRRRSESLPGSEATNAAQLQEIIDRLERIETSLTPDV
jgi:voltage-gated potassium channel